MRGFQGRLLQNLNSEYGHAHVGAHRDGAVHWLCRVRARRFCLRH